MCWLGTQNEGFSMYLQMLSSYQTTILNCSEEYAADLLIYSYPSQNTALFELLCEAMILFGKLRK